MTPLLTKEEIKARLAELMAANERLAKALTEAMNLIEQFVPEDALGYNSSGDPEVPGGFQSWPLRDEYLHHMRAALQQRPEEQGNGHP